MKKLSFLPFLALASVLLLASCDNGASSSIVSSSSEATSSEATSSEPTKVVLTDIVLDVAMNTGGMVAAMPLLIAFYNPEPSIVVKNNLDGSIVDLHYLVDPNGDGVYGGEGDTFAGKYNFYLLEGAVSFSCGNAFPTMAKNSGLAKVIGEKSAGGSCMVTASATLDGLTFNMSSAYQFQIKGAEGKYASNEDGVPPDHEIAIAEAYNMAKLSAFIKTLK